MSTMDGKSSLHKVSRRGACPLSLRCHAPVSSDLHQCCDRGCDSTCYHQVFGSTDRHELPASGLSCEDVVVALPGVARRCRDEQRRQKLMKLVGVL